MTKEEEYSAIIISKLAEIIAPDSDSDMRIDLDDLLQSDENATIFFHCLANIAPTYFYNEITNETINSLEFNHLANKLNFQYLNKPENPHKK